MSYPRRPVYLLYGTQHDRILQARDEILKMLLLPETRNENLTEYVPSGASATVQFSDVFGEIAGDLSTLSFIAEAPKCVVVTNPAELMDGSRRGGRTTRRKAGGGDKKDPIEAISHWIEHELPGTGHHLMLLFFEDEAAGREVQAGGLLYETIGRVGFFQQFGDTKAIFRIEDALLQRNATALFTAIDDLWKPGSGDQAVYNAIVRALRFMMQANIARDRRALRDPALQAQLFPGDRSRNLFQSHPAVLRKYVNTHVYRTVDLLQACAGLLDVYRALRPRPGDLYVADSLGLLRQTLARLLQSPRPKN